MLIYSQLNFFLKKGFEIKLLKFQGQLSPRIND